ncbi:MAG: DUF2189 domain-containing protein [Pseudomonadota bacterium]|nr:hypothetical protein [Pseudomonadales bacterium]MDY6920912.1 DUF2189 domain-containing protein [Pseudomonadota bacterium]
MSHAAVSQVIVRELSTEAPLVWLKKGWADFTQAPLIGLAHGAAVDLFGLVLLLVAYDEFWLLAGAFTGFLALAPVVAVGLYAVSRALERGDPVGFGLVFRTWWSWRGHPRHDWRLVCFGLLLCLSGTGWVLTSAAFITLLSPVPINQPLDFLKYIVLARDNHIFEWWWLLGVTLAAPVYASTVVTIPLLLDRKIPVWPAVLISWRVVLQNPIPLAVWAVTLAVSSMLGILAMAGSVLVIPVLGHASWHVYRDSVDASALPPREAAREAGTS